MLEEFFKIAVGWQYTSNWRGNGHLSPLSTLRTLWRFAPADGASTVARNSLKSYRESIRSFHRWRLFRISCAGVTQVPGLYAQYPQLIHLRNCVCQVQVIQGRSSLKGFSISEIVLTTCLTWLWKVFCVESPCSRCFLFFSSTFVSSFNWLSNSCNTRAVSGLATIHLLNAIGFPLVLELHLIPSPLRYFARVPGS